LWDSSTGMPIPPVGAKVKLHKHPTSDELFVILKGKLKFRAGSKEIVATVGDVVKGRMDIGHGFANIGDEPTAFLSGKGPKPV
jgi:quercetin dioxygenase-like cupin family protein